MYCLICEPLVELTETTLREEEGIFYHRYVCPECNTEYECTSQSGDMIHEYLDFVE
jgi:uncharacterized protein YlaI